MTYVRNYAEKHARSFSLMIAAVLVAVVLPVADYLSLNFSGSLLGPRFHILVTFREIVNERRVLSKAKSSREAYYNSILEYSHYLWLVINLIVSAMVIWFSKARNPVKAALIAVPLTILVNLLASSVAFIVKVHPYKVEVERLVKVIDAETPVKAVAITVSFVDSSLNSSYRKPESILELDQRVGCLDIVMAHLLGLDKAHVILYQGWGSCGQYAVLTSYILGEAGYTVRKARFKDMDHMWAEVLVNKTWYIVDPWYIGKYYDDSMLVPASRLAERFYSSGVIVEYPNGTQVDASVEHGYTAHLRG